MRRTQWKRNECHRPESSIFIIQKMEENNKSIAVEKGTLYWVGQGFPCNMSLGRRTR
jgi:hypothetical protein